MRVRVPFHLPTVLPTVSFLPDMITYVIDGHNGDMYNNSHYLQSMRYIVNGTGMITVTPTFGKCIYRIIPGTNLTLTITRFNVSKDQVDVSMFVDIKEYSDLKITHGSIVITLPTKQVVHILNQEPSALSQLNFIFGAPISVPNRSSTIVMILSTTFGVAFAVIIIWIVYRSYSRAHRLRSPIGTTQKLTITFQTNVQGEYLFEDDDESLPSLILSESTMMSNNEGSDNYPQYAAANQQLYAEKYWDDDFNHSYTEYYDWNEPREWYQNDNNQVYGEGNAYYEEGMDYLYENEGGGKDDDSYDNRQFFYHDHDKHLHEETIEFQDPHYQQDLNNDYYNDCDAEVS